MKKFIKIICILIIMMSITTACFAGGYAIDPDTFTATYETDISKAKSLGETILGYIVNIAAVSSVVIIAFLGLKFMIGSVEQKAEYKKSFMPLIVGMFLVLGTSMIVGMLFDVFDSTSDSTSEICSVHIPQGCEGLYKSEGTCPAGVVCSVCGKAEHVWREDTRDSFGCVYCGKRYEKVE